MIGEITNTASLHWLEWNIHLEKDSSITTLDGEQSAKRSHVGSGEVALFYRGLNRPGVQVSKCPGVQMSRRSLMEVHWMEQAEQRASSPTPSLKKKMKREKRYTPSEAHSSLVFSSISSMLLIQYNSINDVYFLSTYIFCMNTKLIYEVWSMNQAKHPINFWYIWAHYVRKMFEAIFYLTVGGLMTQCSWMRVITCTKEFQKTCNLLFTVTMSKGSASLSLDQRQLTLLRK